MRLLLLAWALALAAGTVPQAAAQGYRPPGSLSVSDPSPDAGQPIVVTVVHCAPAGTRIEVTIDGVVVATVRTDEDEGFVVEVVVPAEAAGEVPVAAVCPDATVASVVDVQVPDLPFQPGEEGDSDESLPTTGATGVSTMMRFAAWSIATGLALVVLGTGRIVGRIAGGGPSPAHAAPSSVRGRPRPARDLASTFGRDFEGASDRPAHAARRAR